eukprot:TRINITY_DN4798_c0_g1_i1.p1 TRINITY_DN4798_c0_g1~~TRINITY_DN4798_c0_g1_i1.p1  ORF type:complete len:251 (+),score=35.82 TRINITY_DN4798_c0_g1_i1:70-753(+)
MIPGSQPLSSIVLPTRAVEGQPNYTDVQMFSVPMESPTHAMILPDGSPVCTPSNVATSTWRTQRCPLAPKAPRYRVQSFQGSWDASSQASSQASPLLPPAASPVNRWPSWASSPAQSPTAAAGFFAAGVGYASASPFGGTLRVQGSPSMTFSAPPSAEADRSRFVPMADVVMTGNAGAPSAMDLEISTPSPSKRRSAAEPLSTTPQTPAGKQSYQRHTPGKLTFGSN